MQAFLKNWGIDSYMFCPPIIAEVIRLIVYYFIYNYGNYTNKERLFKDPSALYVLTDSIIDPNIDSKIIIIAIY
jgi:hypothetical protein